MKKLFLLGLLACAFAGNPEQAEAKSANVLNFQGTIKDAQEQVVNRSMKMTFKIYDTQTGGTALWTEDNQVTVKDGFFNVYLGTLQDLELNFAKELYIEVTLDNGDVLPRTRLTASPFAINAGTASEADTANVAKSVVDGVLTWSNFKADALKVDGLIKGTFPNNLTIDWDNVEKFSIPSDRIAGGPMLHVTATPGGKAGGDMTGTFPNPRLKNEVVENRHIAPNAVTTDKIKDGEVMNADLAENAVTTDKIKNGEVKTDDIADKNVTLPKLAVGEANQVMVTDAAGKEAAWSNDLALPGNLTVKGTTTLEGKLTAKAGAEVTGDATFANNVTVTGKTTTGTLEAGATTLGATNMASAEVAGLTKTGTLEAGATTLGATTTGTLNATGDATFANDVTVTGKTTTGTLEAGATTLGATTMASAEVAGAFAAKGNSVLGTDNTNTITVNGKLAPAAGGTVTANALDGVVVNTANIADGAVTNEKIKDATINIAKLAKAAGEGVDAGKVLVLDVNGKPTYDNLANGLNKAEPATTMGQVHYWDGAKWAVSKNIAPTDGQVLKYNETAGSLVWSEDAEIALPYEKNFTNFDKAAADKASDAIKIVKHNTDQYTGSVMNLELQKAGGAPAVKIKSQADLAHTNGALSVEATSTTDVTAKSTAMKVSNKADIKASEGTSAAMFDNYVKLDVGGKVHKGIDVVSKVDGASGTAVGVSAMATGGAKQVAVFATDDATLNPDKTAVVLAKGAGKDVLVVEGVGAADQNYVATFKASEGNRSVLIEGGDWNKNLKGKDADGLDVDNAALVVRATPNGAIPANVNTAITTPGDPFNGAEGKTAIKTYGDIWANSAIGGTTIVGRKQVVVGTETDKIVILTPPTSATAPATFDRDIQAPNVIATKNVEATEEIKAGTNITANGNANVKGNTTLGTNATSTLTVNATSTFEAPATFNAGVTVDAVTTNDLTVKNNAVIGDGVGTDKLTVNAASEFQKAVTAKEAVTFEKDVTLNSGTAGTKANLNLTEGDVALTKGDVTITDGNIKVATNKFTVDKDGNVATKGTITQDNANANFIQQDSKGTKVHIGIDGAGTKNGYINLWADEKVDTNAGYALFEADATGAKVTNRIDATLAHQTGIGLVKAGPHTGYSVVGTGNADNNDGVALTYKGNNANEARILVNKAGTTVFSVDAEGDVTANALKAKEAATFKKNVTLNSGIPGTNANLNLIEGNVALTKGNVTVTVGNVAVTTGNVAVTTGNVTVEDGNIKVGTAGAEKFTVDKNGNTDIKGNLNAGTTTLASATVTGNATVGGSLEVTGTTTLTGATTLTGELNANGGIKVDGDKFTVSVAGAVEAKGNVKAPTFEGELDGNAATATLADKATNLANGAKFRIPYQSAPNTTEFIAVPDPGGNQVLMYKAASGGSFVWEAIPVDLTANDLVTKINTATNTIDAERLNPAVVLETEVPSVIKDIKGNFAAGLEIEDLKVVTAKIGTKAVTTDKIDDDAVTSAKIANGTIDFVDLKAGAVVEAKIADGAVTPAKIKGGDAVGKVLVTKVASGETEWTNSLTGLSSVTASAAIQGQTLRSTTSTEVGSTLTVGNGLTVSNGGADITGDVAVSGDVTVTGDINGNLNGNVTGNVTGDVTGNVNVPGGKSLTVAGTATFEAISAGITVPGGKTLTVNGTAAFNDDVTVKDDKKLTANGEVELGGTSGVVSLSKAGSTTAVKGALTVAENATFTQNINAVNITGSGTVTGNTLVSTAGATVGNGLTVTTGGATITAGGLTVADGGARINDGGLTVDAGGATITAGGLEVTAGDVVVNNGAFTAKKAVNLGTASTDAITVDGTTTFNENVTIVAGKKLNAPGGIAGDIEGSVVVPVGKTLSAVGDATFNGTLTANGNVNLGAATTTTAVKGTLTVAEATTLAKKLTVQSGGADITGNVAIKNGTFFVGNSVNGLTIEPVNGNLTTDGTLTVEGKLTAKNDVDLGATSKTTAVKGALTVAEATTLTGALTANGAVTLGDATTNTAIVGTASVAKKLTVSTEGIDVLAGKVELGAAGDKKFTVDASNGNTDIKGTLSVAEATTLGKKLTVSTEGIEVTAGNLVVATDKFKVDGNSGNTTVAGTLSVAGNVTANADFTVNDTGNNKTFAVNSRTINLGNEVDDVVTVKGNLTVASDIVANGGITIPTGQKLVNDNFNTTMATSVTAANWVATAGAGTQGEIRVYQVTAGQTIENIPFTNGGYIIIINTNGANAWTIIGSHAK